MASYQAPPPANDPAQTMGLVGMILAIIPCTAVIGLILSIIAFLISRRAGVQNQRARTGIIFGIIWLLIAISFQITAFTAGLYNR
jgi:hypothetical protein